MGWAWAGEQVAVRLEGPARVLQSPSASKSVSSHGWLVVTPHWLMNHPKVKRQRLSSFLF